MTSESASSPEPEASRRGALTFDVFATRVLYVVVFALGAVSTTQVDLWWLLRAGKDVWHTGRVPLTEHYSHTAAGDYWSNHEWLWEAIAYALHHVGGMPMLAAWTGLTVAATAWLIRQASAATGYVVPLVLVIAIPLMSISWTVRPQVTSMLLFAATIRLVQRERYLWVPPLFLLWANLHAQVVMGGILLGATTALAVVEHLGSRSEASRRRALSMTGVSALSAVATLCTPLGPRLWSYVLNANGRPGQSRIAEWDTAFHPLVSNGIFWAFLLAAAICALSRRDRLTSWASSVPLVATVVMTPLAILAVRNIPFFMVAVVPLLMTLLEFRTRKPVGLVSRGRDALVAVAAVATAVVALVWIAAPPDLAWRPVPAPLAATLRACPGPLYNNYNDGAALIWWVPEVKVFVDNRQDPYPADVIDAAGDLGPTEYPPVFARYGIECAYVPRGAPLEDALRQDGWREVYLDDSSVVLVPGSTPRATSDSE